MFDIVRWDPFREMAAFRANMDRLFSRMAELNGDGVAGTPWAPTCDVVETDGEIVITAELPGVKDEDIEITVQDGVLTIKGERRLEEKLEKDHYRRIERNYGGFMRSFNLPPGTREEDIKASVAYGVLRITLPKAKTAENARRIPITAGA